MRRKTGGIPEENPPKTHLFSIPFPFRIKNFSLFSGGKWHEFQCFCYKGARRWWNVRMYVLVYCLHFYYLWMCVAADAIRSIFLFIPFVLKDKARAAKITNYWHNRTIDDKKKEWWNNGKRHQWYQLVCEIFHLP